MKRIHKKKALVVAGVALFAVSIVGVVAFSRDASILRSLFGLGYYRTTHIEEFTSPEDWKTCDITPKTIITKNESSYNIAVRMSMEEFWKAADGETDLPLAKDGVTLADIHFQNQNDWELTDGYYYYKNDLAPGESTNSLLEAVQLSCDANLSPENNVCAETATGTECTPPENPYSGATYHLKVTIETIQSEGKNEWLPSEEGTIYGEIKNKAEENGVDNNIDFSQAATASTGNGNGVNIRAGTENDRFPIMYYRGQVETNNVIWGGFCWKILRTTETGGTKLFYNGLVSNDQCTNNNTEATKSPSSDQMMAGDDIFEYYTPYNDLYAPGIDEYEHPLGYVGYMFDDTQVFWEWGDNRPISTIGGTVYVSRGVEYGSDRKYHLMSPLAVTIAYDDQDNQHTNLQTYIEDGYYYACPSLSDTECTRAYYSLTEPGLYEGKVTLNGYYMVDGDLLPDLRRKIVGSNQHDSLVKALADGWYVLNIKDRPFESDLEDTVFCNDRSLTDWNLKSESYPLLAGEFYNIADFYMFENGVRLFNTHTPTYDCANNDDRFTVSPSIGNGKLQYPIGLMSGDEMKYAGLGSNGSTNVFGLENWGFSTSPITMHSAGSGGMVMLIGASGEKEAIEAWQQIRPSVSLKHGTEFVEGGDGTLQNPYVVKQ